ncbi:hypothetical protein [Sphingomonas rubra]|uniref:Uncharacterized protein n=1 Tax=Sphingomonas rubra TaxID=634430 RepID=A0A1I5SG54_9SPHN|nr:hypothetical protein [Sphingomonas rubra]SFP69690.1 hypothetical protein SAMN04488241_105208 [Sphingomonas rubra]
MAYLAFQDIGGASAIRSAAVPVVPAPVHDTTPPRDRLDPLEWSVVTVARRDRLATLEQPGRWGLLLRALFKQPNPMLADARLEALRRMAVLTWHHGYTVPSHEVAAFLRAGFTADQYESVADSIGAARLATQRR